MRCCSVIERLFEVSANLIDIVLMTATLDAQPIDKRLQDREREAPMRIDFFGGESTLQLVGMEKLIEPVEQILGHLGVKRPGPAEVVVV